MLNDVDLILRSNQKKNFRACSVLEDYGTCGDIAITTEGTVITQKRLLKDRQLNREKHKIVYQSPTTTIKNFKNPSVCGSHVNNFLKYCKNTALLSVLSNKINYYEICNNEILHLKSYTFDVPISGIETQHIQHRNFSSVCLPKCVSILTDMTLYTSIYAHSRPLSAKINEFIGEECIVSQLGCTVGLYDIKCNVNLNRFKFSPEAETEWCEAQYAGHPRVALVANEWRLGLVDFRKKNTKNADLSVLDDPTCPKILKTHVIKDRSALSMAISKKGIMGFDCRMPGMPVIRLNCDFKDLILSDLFGDEKQFLCVGDIKKSVLFEFDVSSGTFLETKSILLPQTKGQFPVVGLAMVPSSEIYPNILQINAWGDIFSSCGSAENLDPSHSPKGYSCDPRLLELFTLTKDQDVCCLCNGQQTEE